MEMKEHPNQNNIIDPSKEEFGFGKAYTNSRSRMIDEKGKYNIQRLGETSRSRFHEFIKMKWSRFLLLILLNRGNNYFHHLGLGPVIDL